MSTRGYYGFIKNGVEKGTYNHSDSYPEWLGFHILQTLERLPISDLNCLFDSIEVVEENDAPTKKQVANLLLGEIIESEELANNWYAQLRSIQGAPTMWEKFIKAKKTYPSLLFYMTNGYPFIKDSLFCEYAYIINLDTRELEFYKGFQHEPQSGNRYGETANDNGYYPCRLTATIPLEEIQEKGWTKATRIFECLKYDKFNFNSAELKELESAGYPKITSIFNNPEELASQKLTDLYIPDYISKYIDLYKLGRAFAKDDSNLFLLPTNRIACIE